MGIPDFDQMPTLPLKLTIVPNSGMHAAEVHNQVRALGRGQKLPTTWTTDPLETPSTSLKASITTWLNTFSDLNDYRTGTVNITWSYTSLVALMPSSPTQAPTPAPTPAGSPTPAGGGQITKQTTDSANSRSTALLLLGWIFASVI